MDKTDKNKYSGPWFLYIAECKDKRLYVGIAKDVDRRIKEHNIGNNCRYTKFRRPVKLLYKEQLPDYTKARKKEAVVKKFSRKKKLALTVN